jgi:hypothetical protein
LAREKCFGSSIILAIPSYNPHVANIVLYSVNNIQKLFKMKTLSIAAALLFAFGTVTFAQDATTTKTSTSKTTTSKTVKKTPVKKGGKKAKKAASSTATPATK